MGVTIKDVAREAGVSIATVSKVINHKPTISEATAAHVEEVMRRLDYAPNSRAANLARRTSRNIVYLTSLPKDIAYANPHMFDIMCGIQNVLAEKGYSLTIVDTMVEPEPCAIVERIIMQQSADGLIVHGAAMDRALSTLLAKRKFPHIVIGHPDDTRLCWVDTNHKLGGQIAAEHLLDRGYTRIGFLGEKDSARIANQQQISAQRLAGFRSAMFGAFLDVREDWIFHSDGDLAGSYQAALNLLQMKDRPDAVICSSNLLAYGFHRMAQMLNVRIPEDIAMITFDQYPFSAVIDPLPTVVQIDVRDMGRTAGKLLLQEIKQPDLRVQSFTTLPQLTVNATTPFAKPE